MGYQSVGKLENFGRVEPFLAMQHRTVDRVGDLLLELTVDGTPVAKPPPGAEAEWLQARHGRLPGELKKSWRKDVLEVEGSTMRIAVFTRDPVAPHVEYPTMPHIIVPRRPGGWLRFWNKFGGVVFARLVHHPGTGGSFMLTTALGKVALMWQEIGREELDRWAREQERLVAA